MVEGQYEALIEEHLGVSNRNPWRVDLDGISPLEGKSIKSNLCTCRVDQYDNLGGTAECILSSLFFREGKVFLLS